MREVKIGTLIFSLAIPLLVGGISAALTKQGMMAYASMAKPPLSPPAWLFCVVWLILYILMGLATYCVITTDTYGQSKTAAFVIYAIQLALNFMWPIIYFNWGMYLSAFVWLILLWVIVIVCAFMYGGINKTAGCLMIPYIVWLTFAAYLNMGTYILNLKK